MRVLRQVVSACTHVFLQAVSVSSLALQQVFCERWQHNSVFCLQQDFCFPHFCCAAIIPAPANAMAAMITNFFITVYFNFAGFYIVNGEKYVLNTIIENEIKSLHLFI
jgi:hypothetical protein